MGEYLTSPKIKKLLTAQARYITLDNRVDVSLLETGDFVAYATKISIVINVANPLTKAIGTSYEERYEHLVGLNAHEAGHILFSDYNFLENMINGFLEGKFYPKEPDVDDVLDKIYLEKIKEENLFSNVGFIVKNVGNIIEDKWMECKVMLKFPGTKRAILKNELAVYTTSRSYEEMKNNNLPDLAIFTNLLLQYVRAGKMKCEDSNILSQMDRLTPLADLAIREDDVVKRYAYVYLIAIRLYPFIAMEANNENSNAKEEIEKEVKNQSHDKHMDENKGSGNNQNQSQDQNNSDESKNNDALEKGNQDNSDCSGKKNSRNKNSKNKNNKNKSDSANPNDDLENLLDEIKKAAEKIENGISVKEAVEEISEETEGVSIINKIIREEKEAKKQREDELQIEIELHKEAKDSKLDENSEIKLSVIRENNVSESNYLKNKAEIMKISNLLAKKFNIKDEKTAETGLLLGNKLNTNQLYRNDKRIFSKNTIRNEYDMAIGVLIDTSGSMKGERLNKAKLAGSIIYDFCKKANIPICIYGHNEYYDEELKSVAEFNSKDGKDKFRIMNLRATGCNRDGMALRFVCNHLEKRNEERKILIIISDGRPNGYGYQGKIGIEDTKKAALEIKKKNISLIAAAIGDDRDCLKQIYGNSFLNISNLKTMPEKLINLIMR